jgi:hypothetical protein
MPGRPRIKGESAEDSPEISSHIWSIQSPETPLDSNSVSSIPGLRRNTNSIRTVRRSPPGGSRFAAGPVGLTEVGPSPRSDNLTKIHPRFSSNVSNSVETPPGEQNSVGDSRSLLNLRRQRASMISTPPPNHTIQIFRPHATPNPSEIYYYLPDIR